MNTIVRINDLDNAFDLLYRHNREIGRDLSDCELVTGIQKFLENGNVFGILKENSIIAMLNVYCNNYETRQAYINNVYVLPLYRGYHLSLALVEHAIRFCKSKGFYQICLHVSKTNLAAVKTYQKAGFTFTDSQNALGWEMKIDISP